MPSLLFPIGPKSTDAGCLKTAENISAHKLRRGGLTVISTFYNPPPASHGSGPLAPSAIVPFVPTSSAGCAICDLGLALWYFLGAPAVSWRRMLGGLQPVALRYPSADGFLCGFLLFRINKSVNAHRVKSRRAGLALRQPPPSS